MVLLTKGADELRLIVVKQTLLDKEQRRCKGSYSQKGAATDIKPHLKDMQAWCLLQMRKGQSLDLPKGGFLLLLKTPAPFFSELPLLTLCFHPLQSFSVIELEY